MAQRRNILLASDLSPRCDRPLTRALLLKQQLNADLLILHIPAARTLSSEQEARLVAFMKDELGPQADAAELIVEYGSVPSTIARVAEARRSVLVITGAARFNSPRDYVLGTAVDYLVRQCPCPVLVVKNRALSLYERLLVGTDFSKHSVTALLTACRFFPGAMIKLINTYRPAFEGFLDRESTASFIRTEHVQAMKKLVASLPKDLHVDLHWEVGEGEMMGVIFGQLRSWHPDLLVIGSHGTSGFAHATVGSKAEELLSHAPSDVLVVRTNPDLTTKGLSLRGNR